jgi:tetratricopeptide (TPR) repeat protein
MMAHGFLTAWQRIMHPHGASPRLAAEGRAAIHCYDPIDDFSAWARCRDRAQFHLGRARRAKDHGRFDDAAREIERALRFDDTSEAYFLVLGQCHLGRKDPNWQAARAAFERAFSINPRNGYTIKFLLDLYLADHNQSAARRTVERAVAAGAPAQHWFDYLGQAQPRAAVAASA